MTHLIVEMERGILEVSEILEHGGDQERIAFVNEAVLLADKGVTFSGSVVHNTKAGLPRLLIFTAYEVVLNAYQNSSVEIVQAVGYLFHCSRTDLLSTADLVGLAIESRAVPLIEESFDEYYNPTANRTIDEGL
ncbi:MAG TPA: hypothetical protein VGE21_01455 [Flavobacteriales bacterium]